MNRYQIEITNEQETLELDEQFLIEAAARVLQEEQVQAATISIALVDNPQMRELNHLHLDHDYDTDVLSFLLDCEEEDGEESVKTGDSPARGRGKVIDGEVIISVEMAQEQAANFSWRTEDEVLLYLIHGLLHLVGYDDLTAEESQLMRSRERALLHLWNLTPHYHEESRSSADPPESGH